MKRKIYDDLLYWKKKDKRNPLILKGARQIGKTYIVKEFSKEFNSFHELNLQRDPNLKKLFEGSLEPEAILNTIEVYTEKKIDIDNDLIFFDEIQESSEALNSLKYFAETYPNSFIITAGSLLGIALSERTFPVGKIEFLDMYPMTFAEFLEALNNKELLQYLHCSKKIPEIIHDKLMNKLRSYYIVGGLPEIVLTYKKSSNFHDVRIKQNQLMLTYRADFSKYSGPANALHINSVFESIPAQLAKDNKKFKMNLLKSGARYSQYKTAIDWLVGAGLCYKIPIIEHIQTPLKVSNKENIFKLYFFDVGLLGALSELPINSFIQNENFFSIFKGAFTENIFLQFFIASRLESLYSWQGKTSEIEFLFQNEEGLFPIEVKSGKSGKLKSLNVFYDKFGPLLKTRVSIQNFEINKKSEFRNLPIYLSHFA